MSPAPLKDGEVQIIPVDLFHPVTGLLFPFVTQRVRDFAEANFSGILPPARARKVADYIAHDLAARVAAGVPTLLILAFVTPDGRLIGHSVAIIQENHGEKWVFVTQCKLDESAGDAVTRGITYVQNWARSHGADILFFETRRSDSSWVRAYGFKTMNHTMWMSLNGAMPAQDLAETKGAEVVVG